MSNVRRAPTLDDVAKAAGVSTATVSRCLNTPDRVVDSTRRRVMGEVDRLGYTPNFGARVMAAKRTYTIGAIIPTMENAIFARGLQAFQEELHHHGYTLLVASSAYRPDIEEQHIRSLVARGADGLLLIGHDRDAEINRYLERQNVPCMVAWTYDAGLDQPSIGFDNRASMRALVEEVLALGHRRIAVVSGILAGNDRALLRMEGIRDAIRGHSLDPDRMPTLETDYHIENGGAAFEKVMAAPEPPTAILCGNDVLAVGAILRAQQLGFDVPGDVSITGFDDIELAGIVSPGLTTVHVPHQEMGQRAARELITMVETGGRGRSVELAARVLMRGSLGPA